MILQSLTGLPAFLAYFCTAFVIVIVYFVVRIPIPNLPQRIAAGELASAIWLGLASLAAGALSAASISY